MQNLIGVMSELWEKHYPHVKGTCKSVKVIPAYLIQGNGLDKPEEGWRFGC